MFADKNLYNTLYNKTINRYSGLKVLRPLLGLILLLTTYNHKALAQQSNVLNIDRCLDMAQQNYPLIKQYNLIEQTRAYSIANAQKNYLPKVSVMGQVTYQSDVSEIPISLPQIDIPAIDYDQYRLYGEISQSLTDLFIVSKQKKQINYRSEVDTQKTAVELYQLKERIANLYFGILMIDAQIKQTELMAKDIQYGIDKAKIAVANGVALKSTVDGLKAELLNVNQHSIALKANRKGYTSMLSLFMGSPVDDNSVFEIPVRQSFTNSINRPEQKLFELQAQAIDQQKQLLATTNWPRISLFLQGGLGKPGLNILNPDPDNFYIAGVRLHWNLSRLYTYRKEKELLTVNQNMIDVQEETFLFNTRLKLKEQKANIDKIKALIDTDKAIVSLRQNIKQTTLNQLTYGTASANDYLIVVNAENKAKQNLILHEIQLLMTEYQTQIITGY